MSFKLKVFASYPFLRVTTATLLIAGILVAASALSRRADVVAAPAVVQPSYNGPHSDWVQKLLNRAGGWYCPAEGQTGGNPTVKAESCQRDQYVAAAVLYAWAAECYSRQGETNKAQAAAEEMYKNLKAADELCSDSSSFGGRGCDTNNIFKCGGLR